ncbi:MAG: hypothetical protein IPN86_15435 [Saprospiraceae bacterium]|nr:hypothetical protein [Saprospiraceae bacterium]
MKSQLVIRSLIFIVLGLLNSSLVIAQNTTYDRDYNKVKVGDWVEISKEFANYTINSFEIKPASNFSFKLGNPVAKVIKINNSGFELEFQKQLIYELKGSTSQSHYFGPFTIARYSNECRLISPQDSRISQKHVIYAQETLPDSYTQHFQHDNKTTSLDYYKKPSNTSSSNGTNTNKGYYYSELNLTKFPPNKVLEKVADDLLKTLLPQYVSNSVKYVQKLKPDGIYTGVAFDFRYEGNNSIFNNDEGRIVVKIKEANYYGINNVFSIGSVFMLGKDYYVSSYKYKLIEKNNIDIVYKNSNDDLGNLDIFYSDNTKYVYDASSKGYKIDNVLGTIATAAAFVNVISNIWSSSSNTSTSSSSYNNSGSSTSSGTNSSSSGSSGSYNSSNSSQNQSGAKPCYTVEENKYRELFGFSVPHIKLTCNEFYDKKIVYWTKEQGKKYNSGSTFTRIDERSGYFELGDFNSLHFKDEDLEKAIKKVCNCRN